VIEFDHEVCANLDISSGLEWLATNGLGGFASSTVSGINTRRYHGLLTAALHPPTSRYVLLSKLEETLIAGERRFDLSANRYLGVFHPDGYRYLKAFRLDPFPVFTYEAGGVTIEKRIFMVQGENTTVIEYQCRTLDANQTGLTLEIRPLIAFRDYHSLTHANDSLNPAVQLEPGLFSFQPYPSLPRLYVAHNASAIQVTGNWYYNFEYAREQERGLEYSEDLFSPLLATFQLDANNTAVMIASTERRNFNESSGLRAAESGPRQSIASDMQRAGPLIRDLSRAASQFVVKRADMKTIIAGYHWFCDWGRDTMIALPGLMLVTGQAEIARTILLAYSELISDGMIPNRFPDSGDQPDYNTVDATLWFFEAIRAYVSYTGNRSLVQDHLYAKLKNIVDWHLRGTRYGIRADVDGLLAGGVAGSQLTWMDSKIGDWVVTPRCGKPVEIQALWYNAIRTLDDFASQFGDQDTHGSLSALAERIEKSFNDQFWNDSAGCFYDVIDGESKDSSIRPNQVIALSLHHGMVSGERARSTLEVVERDLLTVFGLRTLAPSDPRYRGRYEGPPEVRDASYHQGTVWPWLLGPFITAYLRFAKDSVAARKRAAEMLSPFVEHLKTAGLGSISEIFDGDAPHTPRGAIAQAWSVAEVLRAAVKSAGGDLR
jgi:predicted glycogen debranching enzyme